MECNSVANIMYSMILRKGYPSAILIHCGGNDIVDSYNGSLLFNIRNTLLYFKSIMPNTLLIWSFILVVYFG